MRRRAVILALLAVLTASAAAAGDMGPPPGGPGGQGMAGHDPFRGIVRMADELNLSKEQKRSVALILKESREKAQALRESMKTAWRAMGDVMAASPGDEAKVRQAAQGLAKAGEELAVFTGKVKARVDAVLTPEQKAKLAEKRKEFQERRERGRKSLDEWIDENAKS
ncbi:hypothetical protein NNJEOMEG_01562 [Fundidesulfovibrio magnetotacticus]|uniref:P pilus assembly/Cpx signaling pathway, periplasmic inhibitor/zinc-resistance associated protein n=1 Tax=Fundidesulfovibrio magnetotacticus TaxID=2730080 RepID=A0A6V8LTS6_9BACT|nr:periplasmic heavy metal sensor [Fundidesulfovibrio magnetotacticus]GFK93728.1 hypothetical protein NNJEOMEG_01562 [Fundidesulfovibrio magnetotacticus]